MCGIVGKVSLDGLEPVSPQLVQGMMNVIAHRGPDGEGKYVAGPVGLGHRRLSIIDLSTSGAQPMCNEDQTVWVTFNGEIYNYEDLRAQLLKSGHVFRSASDTEVIVHLWEEHGVECVQQLRGMFAFGIWDSGSRTLFAARDRVGIKPLYYAETGRSLVFGSELKSLLVDPEVSRDIDVQSIDRFLTYLYLPGNRTLFTKIRKLDPGHYLLVKGGKISTKQYWDLELEESPRHRDLGAAAEELSSLLRDTVAAHMISDVPVGFLASGGVDSTALLSYAVEETRKPIQTFTVGFSGSNVVDERPFARLASNKFGTTHREISITAGDFLDCLPRYVWHMEEPVCEPPAIALYYVSKLAREHVTVLLSGEGGDEAFGGYPEYKNYLAFERGKSVLGPMRSMTTAVLRMAQRTAHLKRLEKYVQFEGLELQDYYYSRVNSPASYFNRNKKSLYSAGFASALNGTRASSVTESLFARVAGKPLLNQMLYVDTKSWLPDDLLVKADKMTMATSVELRVPFLDHKVLEFAAALPPAFKVRGRETKRILRRAFEGRVPAEVLSRKKAGFPVPFGLWLANDRDFVRETIVNTQALSRGYFRREAVETILDGGVSQSTELFSLLVLELWHRQFADSKQGILS